MVGKKPVVLLIHGAWQSIDQYAALKGLLEQAGLTVHLTANATSGPDASKIRGKTHLDDVARIHAAMEEPLAQGLEIILVCHSYGGVPATVAVENYQIPERQERGLPGGVRHVVYLAAFALPQRGASLLAGLGGQYAPFMSLEDDVVYLNDMARDALFNDVDLDTATDRLGQCVGQSAASFEAQVAFAASEIVVPKTYVACELDNALPYKVQLQLAAALGENSRLVTVKSGHLVHCNTDALPQVVTAIEDAASP